MFLSEEELYVPNGGPDGGDGGRGGDVIFQVDTGKNTLVDFRHIHKYVAKDGQEGGKRRCHGADADDLIVKVPEGTVIKDFESGKSLQICPVIIKEKLFKRRKRRLATCISQPPPCRFKYATAWTAWTGTVGHPGA